MKKFLLNIDFTNASYESFHTENSNWRIRINCIDGRIVDLIFYKTLKLAFNRSNCITGIYEMDDENSFLIEAVNYHYEITQKEQPFKHFILLGVDNFRIFEIIAESCTYVIVYNG